MSHIKHSHTGLALYQQCPFRYMRERIAKDIAYKQNPAGAWGDTVHKGIEKFFETGEFPEYLIPYRDMIMSVAQVRGDRIIEAKLAVTRDWKACDYYDKAAYFRGKVDLLLLRDDGIIPAVDWKTGNSKYDDGSQGERYAAMIFAHFPEAHTVRTRWAYFKDKNIKRGDYTRTQELDLRDSVDSVALSIEHSIEHNAWPKTPTPLCKEYCDVVDCEYNGKRKK